MNITETFLRWLETESPPWRIGQVLISPLEDSAAFSLCHEEDAGRRDLETSDNLLRLRFWIKQDAEGQFRPLKAEKNLCRGWRIEPLAPRELKEALEIIYPTALANWVFADEGRLPITPFVETAGRQTGMYRITAGTSEAQRVAVREELCRTRCLKQRLWDGEAVRREPSVIPLLCPEVCNLFIASCRATIKGKPDEGE